MKFSAALLASAYARGHSGEHNDEHNDVHNNNHHGVGHWGCRDGFVMFTYGEHSQCGWANRKLVQYREAHDSCRRMNSHLPHPMTANENSDFRYFAEKNQLGMAWLSVVHHDAHNDDHDMDHDDDDVNEDTAADTDADDSADARKRRSGHGSDEDHENEDHLHDWYSDNHHDNSDSHSIEWANWFVSEPNGSGNNVFMHADNGKWFDMDGDKWTGPYVCVRDIEWIEEDIYMEEHHSGAKETLTAAAAMAMLLL